VLAVGSSVVRSWFESMRYVTPNWLPSTGRPAYWTNPVAHARFATSLRAPSTPTGARAYTSAACGDPQSTTVTVTTLGSVGGGSARQSPGCSSTHLTVRVLDVACGVTAGGLDGAAVAVDGDA
jgi:hypothetical protein